MVLLLEYLVADQYFYQEKKKEISDLRKKMSEGIEDIQILMGKDLREKGDLHFCHSFCPMYHLEIFAYSLTVLNNKIRNQAKSS